MACNPCRHHAHPASDPPLCRSCHQSPTIIIIIIVVVNSIIIIISIIITASTSDREKWKAS